MAHIWWWFTKDGDSPSFFVCLPQIYPKKNILLNWKMIINHWILRYLLRQIHIFGNLSNNPCDLPVNAEKTDWRMLAYWISLPNKTIPLDPSTFVGSTTGVWFEGLSTLSDSIWIHREFIFATNRRSTIELDSTGRFHCACFCCVDHRP